MMYPRHSTPQKRRTPNRTLSSSSAASLQQEQEQRRRTRSRSRSGDFSLPEPPRRVSRQHSSLRRLLGTIGTTTTNGNSPRSSSGERSKQRRCMRYYVWFLTAMGIYFYFMFGALIPVNRKPPHPPPRPFAMPPPNVTTSVVLMNFARPHMLQGSSLIPTLSDHPAISEIVLCHVQEKTKFHIDHPKIKNIDAVQTNEELGMALRFYYCQRAENPWVIHIDDDMELDESAINELVYYMQLDPHRIVGHYGRNYNFWKVPHRHGYDFATKLSGPVEVILTKALIMERIICDEFMKHVHLVDDLVLHAKPKWNGEDIFASLVANHYYNVPWKGPFRNYALPDINIWQASDELKDDDAGIHDVSGNMDRHSCPFLECQIRQFGSQHWRDYWLYWWISLKHYHYRGRLWVTAKKRLAALPASTFQEEDIT